MISKPNYEFVSETIVEALEKNLSCQSFHWQSLMPIHQRRCIDGLGFVVLLHKFLMERTFFSSLDPWSCAYTCLAITEWTTKDLKDYRWVGQICVWLQLDEASSILIQGDASQVECGYRSLMFLPSSSCWKLGRQFYRKNEFLKPHIQKSSMLSKICNSSLWIFIYITFPASKFLVSRLKSGLERRS